MKCTVGIDLGSTTTKAVVLDAEGTVLGRGITNSRSNYDLAAGIAREEAFITARFGLLRREVEKAAGAELLGRLLKAFRFSQTQTQLASLETRIREELERSVASRLRTPARDAVGTIFRRIREEDLPGPEAKLQILTLAIGRLTRAGYLYIGMDHFAKPGDELAVAQRQGRLQRNFQGYSTHPESDLIGFGVSSISRIGPTYYQNTRTLEEYDAALDEGRLPVWRGIELTQDDLLRRAVIQALACHFRLSIESIEDAYLIDFRDYFARELQDLARLADEGLVELQPDWVVVTPRGRLLVRAVCMVFDKYLRLTRERERYSKVI